MNFTLTPGVYAALNLLSKATRNKVLEAAFAFVICGTRPTSLSKNLLVMFMMVVDSASEGKLTYTPDEPAEKKDTEIAGESETTDTAQPQAAQQSEPESAKTPQSEAPIEQNNYYSHMTGGNRMLRDGETTIASGTKKPRRRKRNRK